MWSVFFSLSSERKTMKKREKNVNALKTFRNKFGDASVDYEWFMSSIVNNLRFHYAENMNYVLFTHNSQ